MDGILILFIVAFYLYIGFIVLDKVQKKYQTEKTSYITLALIILIPTWDLILGFPAYASLCLFHSGSKIYKTVDDVEGYYIGEVDKVTYNYLLSEKDYKYKDFKLKSDGKYYRTYWINNNYSKLCIKPDQLNNPRHAYTSKFNNGQCIAIEQINENDVSKWEVLNIGESNYIPIIRVEYGNSKIIKDRQSGEILGKNNYVEWNGSWVIDFLVKLLYGRGSGGANCGGISSKKDDITLQILKVKTVIESPENIYENFDTKFEKLRLKSIKDKTIN